VISKHFRMCCRKANDAGPPVSSLKIPGFLLVEGGKSEDARPARSVRPTLALAGAAKPEALGGATET